TAELLDQLGARVALVGRDRSTLSEVAQGLHNSPVLIQADLVAETAADQVVSKALGAMGAVTALVNNAAAAARVPVTDLTVETINEIFAVNVRSLLLLCARVVPSMIELGGGSIVNLSSITSSVGTPSRAAYAASKGAVDAITRALAQELGEHNIRV